MANITAAEVKKLRDATGAGMMAAKRALEEAEADFERAVEILRIKGEAKAKERGASRHAGNGLVAAADGAMIQLGCETDFVAKGELLQQLAADVVAQVAATGVSDPQAVADLRLADGRTVTESLASASAATGEKVELARVVRFDGQVTSYLHRRASDLPPQVGVLVEFVGEDVDAARAAAMQIAAMRPQYVRREDVPSDVVEGERRIAEATAREEGRPEQALPKIIDGRVNAFFKDVVLLEQPSVQDAKRTVGDMLARAGVSVTRFARFEIGAPQ
jgi:elongation factor Ts